MAAVVAGGYHTCALHEQAAGSSAGATTSTANLVDGSTTNRTTPVAVTGWRAAWLRYGWRVTFTPVRSLAAAGSSAGAYNNSGQLGDGHDHAMPPGM